MQGLTVALAQGKFKLKVHDCMPVQLHVQPRSPTRSLGILAVDCGESKNYPTFQQMLYKKSY